MSGPSESHQSSESSMAVTEKATRRALLKLLSVIAGPAYQKVDETEPCDRLIEHVIELTKTEASEGAALIEACAPHGKSMLTHAQQKLEILSEFKVLYQLAKEQFSEI